MAQLHDTIISGSLRTTGDIYTPSLQAQKLQVPATSNGTTYSVGSNGQIIKSNGTSVYWDAANNHEHIISDVKPIETKTYTGIIATEDNIRYGTFYFLKIYPTSWTSLWHVKYRLRATAAGSDYAKSDHIVEFWGGETTIMTQYIFNSIRSISYRPIYYHTICLASQTGYNDANQYNHYFGAGLRSSWAKTTAANSRTFIVDLLEYDNCTASLLDTIVRPDGISGLATTAGVYASTLTSQNEYNGYNQGLLETNDSDDMYRLRREAGNWTVAPGGALYSYQLVVQVDSNKVAPLNYVNNGAGNMSKTMNTDLEFDPFGIIEYYYSTTGISAGDPLNSQNLYQQMPITMSYSFNINSATNPLTAHKAVYLKCQLQSNGKVKMACANSTASPIVQDLPTTDDNYLYIYLGVAYTTYQIILEAKHPVYYCKNGRISLYTGLEFPVPVSYGGTGATTADGACTNIGAVKKSGDTMTGPLICNNNFTANSTAYFSNNLILPITADYTSATNNLSANVERFIAQIDSNDKWGPYLKLASETNGATSFLVGLYNYDTSGTATTTFNMSVSALDGDVVDSYCSHPIQIREGIGHIYYRSATSDITNPVVGDICLVPV